MTTFAELLEYFGKGYRIINRAEFLEVWYLTNFVQTKKQRTLSLTHVHRVTYCTQKKVYIFASEYMQTGTFCLIDGIKLLVYPFELCLLQS